MKPLLAFGSLILLAISARADFIIEQTIESGLINGKLTYEIKGDDARIEMPSPLGGKVTTIIHGATGDMVTLMEQQKMAMTMNFKEVGEKAMKENLGDLSALQPKPTGEKAKVGQWDTEVYQFMAGENKAKMWVAKDFPNYKAIQDAMSKASKTMTGGALDPSKVQVPGMTVKTEVETAMGKMTTTLVSVKEATVPESDFKVPEGYQTMKAPAGLGQ